MAEQKKREEILTSPKGVAKYPRLDKPQTEIMGKPVKPSYTVNLLLPQDSPEATALIDVITKAHAAGYAEAKKANPKKKYQNMGTDNMFREETDKDGAPTGNIEFRFKCAASGTRKDGSTWAFRPSVFDVRGGIIPVSTPIFGGSVMKVAYSIRHAAMETGSFYSSLNLKAVQVFVVKSQSDRSASDFGFEVEEGDAFGEQVPTDAAGDVDGSADF